MRLIDADSLIKSTDKEIVHMWEIALAPTVDAVEVVRCEDCKHYVEDINRYVCVNGIIDAMPTDYCSWGERREDETN